MTDEPENPEPKKPEYEVGYKKPPTSTQFGGENAPTQRQNIPGATKPWSYRNAARYLSAQRIASDDPHAIGKLLSKNPTVAERITAAAITKASKGDMRAIEYLTEQVDGKVAQTSINADIAAILAMDDDELEQLGYNSVVAAKVGAGESGTTEAGGSTGADDNQSEPAGEAADPTGL